MSNITTSYVRIFRKNGSHLSTEEIDSLFERTVKSYGEFGSYWVRITKYYRPELKCLDIQFGSGKIHHGYEPEEQSIIFSAEEEILNTYDIFERRADDGGFRDFIQYHNQAYSAACPYTFDKIRFKGEGLIPLMKNLGDPIKQKDFYELSYSEEYYAVNSRSMMDLVEGTDFYGEALGFDPAYAKDFMDLTPDGNLVSLEDEFLKTVFEHPHINLPEGHWAELLYKGRPTQRVENKNQEALTAAADYWDNCVDEVYLNYINRKL